MRPRIPMFEIISVLVAYVIFYIITHRVTTVNQQSSISTLSDLQSPIDNLQSPIDDLRHHYCSINDTFVQI